MNERFLNVLFLVFGTLVYHFMKISILIYIILITNGLFLKKKFQLFRCLEKQKKHFFFPLHLLQTESKLHRVKLSPGAQNASGSASDIWTLPRSGCSFPFMFLRMWGDLEQRRWTNTPLQSEFFRACHGNHIYFLNMSNLASFLSSFFVVFV